MVSFNTKKKLALKNKDQKGSFKSSDSLKSYNNNPLQ